MGSHWLLKKKRKRRRKKRRRKKGRSGCSVSISLNGCFPSLWVSLDMEEPTVLCLGSISSAYSCSVPSLYCVAALYGPRTWT